MNDLKEIETIVNVLINITIPEKLIERHIEWNMNDIVGSLKNYILKLIPDLDDPLNYGFFLPAENGKNGKFLQEERILNHYLIEMPYKLELRKKARLYYSNIPNLKKINSKSNQKQLILNIKHGELMKINKLLNNGLDPNFHVNELAETPLSLACRLQDPHKIIMALVNNGAYLDFRAADSLTALHKVAKEGLLQPMKTLLQLGQSPNCKDSKGFTPLYYCIENDAPHECVNILLFEHSIMGVRDDQGFQEIHKACLYGRTIHLDHLLTYGANIDAKTNKGSSALHICALHNHGSCARLLLYRGITRYALDGENKSAYQTALLSNNLEIADLIQNFRDEDVVPVTVLPKFNEKRRSVVPFMTRLSTGSIIDDIDCKRNSTKENQININDINTNGSNHKLSNEGFSISPAKTNPNMITQHSDSQSLKCYVNPTYKINPVQLNTWSSPILNVNSITKARIPIASIISSKLENIPRTIVLQKGPQGFGFVIRGMKGDCEIIPNKNICASQYFECVTENSPAHVAGLLSGDYLLEVNNIDVHEMSHENVVKVIQSAGDCLILKVITVNQNSTSTGIFDKISESKSNSDSLSLISGSSTSLNIANSSSILQNSKEISNSLHQEKLNAVLNSQDSIFLQPDNLSKNNVIKMDPKKTFNPEDDSKSILKKPKGHAPPPPPTRNDNTSLSIFQTQKDSIKITENSQNLVESFEAISVTNDFPSFQRNDYFMESALSKHSKPYIPPPDYNSQSDMELRTSIKNSSLNFNSSETEFVPPPPPPPPVIFTQRFNDSKNITSKVTLNKDVSNDLLKNISQTLGNNDHNPLLIDHSEALKFAILSHRKKIEEGDTNDIDEKLKENKVSNKSLIFEANLLQTNEIKTHANSAANTIKNVDLIDNAHLNLTKSKNPTVLPKPSTQYFMSSNQAKSNNNVLPKTDFPSPNDKEEISSTTNLRIKAEKLRSNLLKKEQETKKGTLYFTNEK